jgi:hypothetical protein
MLTLQLPAEIALSASLIIDLMLMTPSKRLPDAPLDGTVDPEYITGDAAAGKILSIRTVRDCTASEFKTASVL